MRLLIGIYLVTGALCLYLALALGGLGIYGLVSKPNGGRHGHNPGEEALVISLISLALASLPIAAAYGLWRRWNWMRLIFMGMSLWSLAGGVTIAVVALASWAGAVNASEVLGNEPIHETLGISFTTILLNSWQYWVLTRHAVRDSFLGPRRESTLKTPDAIDH